MENDPITTEKFNAALRAILREQTGEQLLSIPGIYEVVSEHFNNEAIKLVENEIAAGRIMNIEGKQIKKVRAMTDVELANECWHSVETVFHTVPVIELDDGSFIYPSASADGRKPGALVGINANGERSNVLS